MKPKHPAIEHVLNDDFGPQLADHDRSHVGIENTTSPSLARALAIGCLSRLDPSQHSVSIWDPAAGSGFAGHLLASSLRSAGVDVQYRGQDIQESAVSVARRRFEAWPNADIAVGDTLAKDEHDDFRADLVIVDAPWGLSWDLAATPVERRHREGAFSFGLPQRNDSTWLFISLALEKLRPAAEGGGRVAALVTPSALSIGGKSADIREAILAAGLLESVTRLPEALAPNTRIPLYLLTFASGSSRGRQDGAMIADLQAQFTTQAGRRSITDQALRELESGLRTGKTGPRNRRIPQRHFIRRDAGLAKTTDAGQRLAWRVTTYKDTPVDEQFLESRYGPDHGISLEKEPAATIDLNPSRLFGDESREILADLASKGWPHSSAP